MGEFSMSVVLVKISKCNKCCTSTAGIFFFTVSLLIECILISRTPFQGILDPRFPYQVNCCISVLFSPFPYRQKCKRLLSVLSCQSNRFLVPYTHPSHSPPYAG